MIVAVNSEVLVPTNAVAREQMIWSTSARVVGELLM